MGFWPIASGGPRDSLSVTPTDRSFELFLGNSMVIWIKTVVVSIQSKDIDVATQDKSMVATTIRFFFSHNRRCRVSMAAEKFFLDEIHIRKMLLGCSLDAPVQGVSWGRRNRTCPRYKAACP